MKQFLRVAIVVLVLLGLGVVTYIAFFQPANEDEVYLVLSEVNSEDAITEYNKALNSISASEFSPSADASTYVNNGAAFANVASKFNSVLNDTKDSRSYVQGLSGELSIEQYSYQEFKNRLDIMFNYYYAYSQAVCKTVPKSALKTIKASVKDYKSAWDSLIDDGFYGVESLQNYVENQFNANIKQTGDAEDKKYSETAPEDLSTELRERYKRLVQLYRNYISAYANLITDTKEFVVEYVFDGKMITDRESLLYDLAVESMKKATSVEYSFDYGENDTIRKTADDYLKSSIKFLNLAMKDDEGKESALTDKYYIEANSVLYNNAIYTPSESGVYTITIGTTDNEYIVKNDGDGTKVVSKNDETSVLSGAVYYLNGVYTTTAYTNATPLTFKKMIKCYNRIMEHENGKDSLDMLINLTYDQKIAFVNDGENADGIKIRAPFVEVLHEDIAYVLVCCGFHS